MFSWSRNKMLSIEFLMLLILLLEKKTINASTLPSSAFNDLTHAKSSKCEQISITHHCPELKYNQTMVSTFANGHHMDINDANEMVINFKFLTSYWKYFYDRQYKSHSQSASHMPPSQSTRVYLLIPSTAARINRNRQRIR